MSTRFMGMPIEVVVRFAGDLVDVVRVPAGSTYTLGTTTLTAAAGTQKTIGLVTVTMTKVATEAPVPRRRVEGRPYFFGGASLAGHIALVLAALALVPFEVTAPVIEQVQPTQRGSVRIKRFTSDAQTIEHAPEPVATVPATERASGTERDTPAPQMVQEFKPSEITGGGLATEGPKDSDGTAQRFDPSTDPAFDTIKSGDYSTVSTGRLAGDEYAPQARNSDLVVITCDRFSCLVVGGEKATRIRAAVEERVTELTDCYKRAAETGGGKVEIDFGIDAKGGIKDLEVGEVDTAGLCVAKILRTLNVNGAPVVDENPA